MARLSRSFMPLWVLAAALLCGSAVLSAQLPRRDRIPPTPPTSLAVVATTARSVTLAWGASTDNSGQFGYIICCAGGTVTVNQTVTTHTIEGLQPGKTYTVRVYARDAAGNISAPSNTVTVTLPGDLGAPTKPAVELLDAGPTHASLVWSSTDDGASIWFTIYIDGQPVTTLSSRSGTFTCATVMVATGCVPLTPETTYTFTVRAVDEQGNVSPFSDPLFVTTEPADPNDQSPPTSPANVTAENIGGHLMVRWEPSTDDVTPQSFIRYDVTANGRLLAVIVGGSLAEIEPDPGVTTIAVVAVDSAGNVSSPGTITVSF